MDELEQQEPEERFSPDRRDERLRRRVRRHSENFNNMEEELSEVVVGQEEAIGGILTALMVDGNILLEGVPGLGKSMMVEALAEVVEDADFNRVQFVPDMLPADILGQKVFDQKTGDFRVNRGPVFTDFLLADEINRAPPKTQAAMMEVMQEKKVSIEGKAYELESPYLVMATQNPLEQKGTYPLPEAMIDRFFMKLVLDYPDTGEEGEILASNTIRDRDIFDELEPVTSKAEIAEAQEDVRNVHVSEEVRDYIVSLVEACRGETEHKLEALKYIDVGPSPRASIWLSMGGSAEAIKEGRSFVVPQDVKEVALPVLRHRVRLNYEARVNDVDSENVVRSVLNHVEAV